MPVLNKKPDGCNPTMELAISAVGVSKKNSIKTSLAEPAAQCAPGLVTLDYLEGFHSRS